MFDQLWAAYPEMLMAIAIVSVVCTIITWRLFLRQSGYRWIFTLGWAGILGLVVALLYMDLNNLQSAPPDLPSSTVDPSRRQQESMVDAAQDLRRLTNETKPNGDFAVEYSPEKGVQPIPKKASMVDAYVLVSQPVQTRHLDWRASPHSVIGTGAGIKVYEYLKSKNPVSWNTGFDPLMTHLFCTMVATGKRSKGETFTGNIAFWIDRNGQVLEGSVPYWAAVNFDSMAVWLNAWLETPSYPHIARWCSEALKADSINCDVAVPGYASAHDDSIENSWDPSGLNNFGKSLNEALLSGSPLPNEFFPAQTAAMNGADTKSPFKGGGIKRRVAGLLWGTMLDDPRVFAGNETLALQCAAFLAYNPGFRLRALPQDSRMEADENRAYISGVANHAPKLAGFTEIVAGFGSQDPSLQFRQHWVNYSIKALPLNGDYNLLSDGQIAAEKAQRNLQNTK